MLKPIGRPTDMADRLRCYGSAPALVLADDVLSYAQLAQRVDELAIAMGPTLPLHCCYGLSVRSLSGAMPSIFSSAAAASTSCTARPKPPPAWRFFRRLGSSPIPGGALSLVDGQGGDISEAGVEGELTYAGPNVMMGYAEARADLIIPSSRRAAKPRVNMLSVALLAR